MKSLRIHIAVLALLALVGGCQTTSKDREARIPHGYIYYCDGAGGGGMMKWSGGLRQGLRDGGYPGTGEIFGWNTGLGVLADQDASANYKRGKARKMAQEAVAYSRKYPGAPVTFFGLSAGTSVVVYGLEAMPSDVPVTDVVLCGASISSTYDLTRALRNLSGKMYVFTSENDAVLGFLVPMSGTADRASGSVAAAGLRGFRMPYSASADTRRLYAKVVTIPWRPEYSKLGYSGGHTGALSSRFVAAHIAPRLTKQVGPAPQALASTKGKVRNPDYERWAKFGVGSSLVMEGSQEYQGIRSPVRLTVTLKSKSAARLLIEREFYLTDQHATLPSQIHSLIAEAWIDPIYHPSTDPGSRINDLPAKQITFKGRAYSCAGRSIESGFGFPDWGAGLTATLYRCPDIPGAIVQLALDSHFHGEPFKFEGHAVDFDIVRE